MNKLKMVAAAAAVLAATSAHARIDDYRVAAPGELMLSVINFNDKVSALFDLGVHTMNFNDQTMSAPGTVVTFDLKTGQIGGNTSLAGSLAGNKLGWWSDTWNLIKPYMNATNTDISNIRFGVWGGDEPNNGEIPAGENRRLVTTTSNSIPVRMSNPQLINAMNDNIWSYQYQNNLLAGHADHENGSAMSRDGDRSYEGYRLGRGFPAGGVAGSLDPTQSVDKDVFTVRITNDGVGQVTQTKRFYFGAQNPDANGDGTPDYGKFRFDTANGILTYEVPAVPEAGNAGMMLAGLSVLGLVAARRRRA